jgi:5-methylcytosine-specific restriction protein A
VIDELGMPFVRGYPPLRNIGSVKGTLIRLINEHWGRTELFEAPTADADEFATRVESAAQKFDPASPPPPGSKVVTRIPSSSSQFARDPNVAAWVRRVASGVCEACDNEAPFVRGDGPPYLEVHHMRPLSEGGPDTADNTIAGCPNCHRRLHYANDREQFRRAIIAKLDRLVDHPKRAIPRDEIA